MQTKNWPTTNGTVLSTTVERVASSKGSSKYKPVINYSYKINEEEFLSNRFSTTQPRGTMQWANQVVSQYSVNKKIVVYYNPKNSNETVLNTTLQSDNYWMVILSSFLLIVVSLAFIKQLKQPNS